MACIHFKFKNSLDYDSITFDGLHIALRDLKRMIMNRKKLRDTDDDLQIINAITKKAYTNEDEMIPKNSSVIVARIPVTNAAPRNGPKTLNHPNAYKEDPKPVRKPMEVPVTKPQDPLETGNLIDSNASEEDKIKAMMRQSTMDFDPSNYINNKKAPIGTPSPTYICKKCGKSGHFIQNCPVEPGEAFDKEKIAKRPTGIPHSFLTKVNDPNAKGALLIGPGQYGVPTIDMNAYQTKKKERPPFLPEEKLPEPKKEEIPAELLCPLCRDLLSDAVLIPCCGTSFCDDCIRNELLDSEDHECPQCHETDKSPDSLIANKSLRSAVFNYRNETGYTKITKAMLKSQQEKVAVERAARKSEVKEKRTAPAISRPYEKPASAQAIPTYGMKAGQHYKVGGFQGGRSPGSPANASPKISDSQNGSDQSAGTKPSLLVSTTPGPVPGGLSPPTPCKDEANLLTPASSAQVSVQSTSTSVQPSLSASVTSVIPQRAPVIPASFPTAPIQTVGVPYRPPLPPMVNPSIPPPGFVAPPPTGPFGAGPRFPPAPAVIPPFQAVPPPSMPLSKEEFYRRQKKMQELEKKKKADPLDVFARELMDYKKKPKSASRSRSRSRSRTPRRSITPRRSRTRSKSRSITPRKRSRSLTPRKRSRSLTPRKRSYTPRSRTRSRSRSPKRSRSPYGKPPYRSRSRTRSRTPPRYRSRSRSFSPRYRSRSPRPRSYSRSPVRYRGRSPPPRWRSRSRSPGRYDRWSPPPYGRRRSRSPPPPLYRGRSRSPPPYDYFRPEWDAPPPMYGDYRGPPARPGGRGPIPPHYQYPQDQFNRFDPHAYDEFYHEYYARYGMPPPPPPANQMYDASSFPPRRSRSPRDRRPFKERPLPRPKAEDSKTNRPDKKSVDKKPDKKSSKSSSKREEEKASKKKKSEKPSNKEKDEESKVEEKKENGVEKKEEVKDSQSKKKKKGSSKTSKKEPVESDVKEEKSKDEEDKKPVKSDEEKDGKEDIKEKDAQEKVEKKEIKDVENLGVKKEKLEDVKESKEEKVRSKKKSSAKKDSGEKLESLKSPKQEIKSPKEETSKEAERKAKRKHKKMVKEVATKEKKLVEDDEAEESPAKRQKTEPVTDSGDQIMLSPPILSKWEKEDYHDDVSPRRSRKASPDSRPSKSKQDRRMLPRSVIEKAEKALALKQPQPISVASSIKPSSSLANRLEKSPPPKLRSPEGKPRRVYVEKESNKKLEEDSRKVLSRDRSMQITVSGDVKSKTKSKDSKKEVKDLRESLLEKRRASTRSSSTEEFEQNKGKGFSHDDRLSVNYAREKDWDYIDDDKNADGWLSNKVKGSSKSTKARKDITEERRSASKEKSVEKRRKSREEKESPRRSRKDENGEDKISKKNSRSQEKKDDKKRKEDLVSKRDNVEKVTEKEEHKKKDDAEKSGGTKQQIRVDRKESLFDESAFVPDYNETMGSESEEDVPKQELKRQYSTAESEKVESESEEESSGEEREKKHKKKKSKHKKNKKKHKKHKKKHKKQDGDESS